MNNLRQELDEILDMRRNGGGFHYVQKAQKLRKTAHQSRQWYHLIKTPFWRWKGVLSESRDVLDQLTALGISR